MSEMVNALRNLWRDACRRVKGDLPVALERWVADPVSRANAVVVDPPRETCAADDQVAWHGWKDESAHLWPRRKSGEVIGWRPGPEGYRQHLLHLDALEHLTCERVVDGWTCDIGDIAGLGASKSPLSEYDTLDAMIQARRPELVSSGDPASIYHLLTHDGLRILDLEENRREKDRFLLHRWDGRVFLSNLDGSHHFAAARCLARRFGVRVPLRGRLYCRWIDAQAVEALVSEYALFAIDGTLIALDALHEALQAYRAPYLRHCLPKGLSTPPPPAYNSNGGGGGSLEALFLPRAHARARRVAAAMVAAGFFDVGAHLEGLVRRQVRPGAWRAPADRS